MPENPRTTFILGGRRSGKTVEAMRLATEVYEEAEQSGFPRTVICLYPNRAMAIEMAKEYPMFFHQDMHTFSVEGRGYSQFRTLFVLDNIEIEGEWILRKLAWIPAMFDTVATASPKLYNIHNIPEWVRWYHRASDKVYLDPDTGDHMEKLEEVVSAISKSTLFSRMAGYRIKDIDLPEHLEPYKEEIILWLNEHDTTL